MSENLSPLRFQGSLWCNLDVALRNLDQLFGQVVRPLGLSIIEWYVLRALYEADGQHASELARAVGRAATSFTPNLNKLEQKGYIERHLDTRDRRAVRIYLTDKGRNLREAVLNSAEHVDRRLAQLFSEGELEVFRRALAKLQSVDQD